jgi:hypothetical protein
MTYQQLLDTLDGMTEEQLSHEVLVGVHGFGYYYPTAIATCLVDFDTSDDGWKAGQPIIT